MRKSLCKLAIEIMKIHVTLDTYADMFDRLNFDSTKKFEELMERISQEQT